MSAPRPVSSPQPPSVLMLGMAWDRPGGLNRYFLDLRAALEGNGVDCDAVVLGPATEPPGRVAVVDDELAPLPRRLIRYARAARRASTPDTVIDAHFAMYAWWPVVAGRLRAQPLVVHFHGPWAAESEASGDARSVVANVKRRLERGVYRRAARVVVLSEAFKDLVVANYGVERDRVIVIPPGVDLDHFTPGRAAARRRLSLPDDGQIVFTVRRLVARMGLDVLLDAWASMDHRPGRTLLIAGEGPERAALEARIDDLGVSGSVRLVGRISEQDLADHYRAADLSVVPTVALEGFGLVALESLACGTPPVVTDVGGLPDVVRRLDETLIVAPRDPAALAARLATALAGVVPTTEECRAYAETFSWKVAAERNAEVYRAAAEDAGGAGATAGPPPRVVYLDHCALDSGAEIALVRMVEALGATVRPHAILAEDGPLRPRLVEAGADVEVLPMTEGARGLSKDAVQPARLPLAALLHVVVYVGRLALRLRQLRPDVVHTNSLKAALYGGVAGRLAGVPVVWHARDYVDSSYLPGPAVRLVRLAAWLLPTAVVANSAATLDSLRLPARARRKAAVVADPFERVSPVHQREAASQPGLRVGMVGRLAPWKGQHVFIEAFARARPSGPDRAVVIGSAMFGEDDYEQTLRELVAKLGLEDRVELAGFRSDVEAELADLDVLVHASVSPEPFGQVVVEGLAAGLAVVASDAGGPAEIIRPGVDGLLCPPGDVDALAEALDRLLGDAELRGALGAAGRARAESYAPKVIAPEMLEVYSRITR